jgi:phenylpropionate dioxygenase-like ring-hydroxylating dioxygenase large terminal subunit
MFLKNAWYVAAWSHEIGRSPAQRWIAGEPLVLFRTEAGGVAALEDRCPHRRAPLSLGKLIGDTIQCGYHGVTLDCSGACVRIPGQDTIPPSMRTRSYPAVEKWQWIWVWLGDAAAADESLIPDFRWNSEPGWVSTGGTIDVKANYQLLTDNLLDLTHETYVHSKTIGNNAIVEWPMTHRMEGNEVHVQRIMRDTPPPPLFAKVRGTNENIDRWQVIRFQVPANVSIDARGYPAGSEDISRALRWFSINSITPVDERTSRYYWTITRCFAQDDEELTGLIHRSIHATFMEDVALLEQQQVMIETDRPDRKEVGVRADAGSVAARRVLERLIASEAPRIEPAGATAL